MNNFLCLLPRGFRSTGPGDPFSKVEHHLAGEYSNCDGPSALDFLRQALLPPTPPPPGFPTESLTASKAAKRSKHGTFRSLLPPEIPAVLRPSGHSPGPRSIPHPSERTSPTRPSPPGLDRLPNHSAAPPIPLEYLKIQFSRCFYPAKKKLLRRVIPHRPSQAEAGFTGCSPQKLTPSALISWKSCRSRPGAGLLSKALRAISLRLTLSDRA